MDYKNIKDALSAALANGTESIDDLSELLSQAQEDIEKLKAAEKAAAEAKRKEEEERKRKEEEAHKKRGNEIAAMANRVLDGTTTDEDVALVLTSYFQARGMKDIVVDPSIVKFSFKATKDDWDALDNLVEKLCTNTNCDWMEGLYSLLASINCESEDEKKTKEDLKKAEKIAKETADKIINSEKYDRALDKFFKDLGIERHK